MNAVDTNILVRLLTEDDPDQTAVAQGVFEAGPIWIAKTVWLETAWVLHRSYGFDETSIRDGFLRLLGLPNVQAEDQPAVSAALALVGHGLDFADALHLSSRPPGARFVSFDRSLVRRAQRAGEANISEPA
jgi:predicted nucleic-acid-binding protein